MDPHELTEKPSRCSSLRASPSVVITTYLSMELARPPEPQRLDRPASNHRPRLPKVLLMVL